MGRRTSALTAALLCSACETDPRAEYPGQAAFESASSIVYVDDRGV